MRPELYRLFDISFPSYFVLLLTGFLLATVLGTTWARRIGKDPDVIVDLGLSALLMGIIGARLLHVLADGYFWDYVNLCVDPSLVDWPISQRECASPRYDGVWDAAKGVCHPKEADCFAWAKFWSGGLTYYGGFIGAMIAAVHLLRKDRFPFWKAADMAGFAIPVGLAFGRMGCLLGGCCFGAPTTAFYGLSFPPGSPASDAQFQAKELVSRHLESLPVHPTQIYESAASIAIAAFCLFFVHPRKRYDGQVFVAFVVLYAIARALIEILRRDDRGGLLGLSTSQLIGFALIGFALFLHRWLKRNAEVDSLPSSA